jgi:hypothetical protein
MLRHSTLRTSSGAKEELGLSSRGDRTAVIPTS